MTRQVRLDDDVAEALERAAEREGVSLSAASNRWLRKALAMKPARSGPLTPASAPGAGLASVRAARASGPCSHPVGRRIGEHCGQCGAIVRR